MTEITRKRLSHLQGLPGSRSWHQNIVDCHQEKRDLTKETLSGEKGIWLGKSETNPDHIVGTENGATERENNPKAGMDESFRDFIVADTRTALGPGTKRTASWETQETPHTCTGLTTSPRKPDE